LEAEKSEIKILIVSGSKNVPNKKIRTFREPKSLNKKILKLIGRRKIGINFFATIWGHYKSKK
jgi:hypothetical protein